MLNELKPELLSISALNSFTQHTSSSRATMFSSSHLGQSLVIEGCSKKRCRSGLEEEFGKYTFSIKVPCDAKVIKVIPKFKQVMGEKTLPDNPTTTIIYENDQTKEVGMVKILDNSVSIDQKHQHFGFKYKKKSIIDKLQPGTFINKGTILADSPAIDDEGDYRYGIEANTAFMSVPGIIEDGLVVSDTFVKKLKTKGFEERTVNWGDGQFPLNLYGNAQHYKPFPEIGQRVRPDGLLFAMRTYDDLLSPVEMSKRSLGEPDTIFDKLTYAEPNAKIVDVKVHHNTMAKNFSTPTGMEYQANKYFEAELSYHQSVIEVYDKLYHERRSGLSISPEFHREVVFAMGFVGPENIPALKRYPERIKREIYGTRVDKKYRRSDINDWMVTVQFEYDVVPDLGFKISNIFGGYEVFNLSLESE